MAGLQLSGLASGFDWKSIVDQLIELERTPIYRMQSEQSTNENKNTALSSLETKLTTLKASAVALKASGLYARRSATLESSTSTWSASASDNTAQGSYKIAVSQLATASSFRGAANLGTPLSNSSDVSGLTIETLPISTQITEGDFTVNGKRVSVSSTDSLADVLDRISTATGGQVTAAYNENTDKIELTSTGPDIVLGAANDSSNFLNAMRLSNEDNAAFLTSGSALGTASLSSPLASARLNGTLSGQNPDGTGSFTINGVVIDYDINTDSLSTILSRINNSDAGVSATFDSVNDSINFVNNKTGDMGFSFEDTTGNLLETLGITAGATTLTRGKNALYSVNGGGTLSSASNTLSSGSHGIEGFSVTVSSTDTQTITVAANTDDAKSAINDFISKYNDVQDYIEEKSKISTSDGKVSTSILSSNREVQDWARKLRSIAFEAFAGSLDRMDDLGIDFTTGTNKLEVKDSTKLADALSDQSNAVNAYFSTSDTGFSDRFSNYLQAIIGNGTTDGLIDKQMNLLVEQNKGLDEQIAEVERRLVQQRSLLESSFIKMEEAQQKTNNILSQLSKSFSSS